MRSRVLVDFPLVAGLIGAIAACAVTSPRAPGALSAMGQETAAGGCRPPAAAHLRTILYFGLARPAGTVSDAEWQAFVRDEVTPRFPEGLTTWEVDGQWRGADGRVIHERSKVLLLVHGDTPTARAAIQELIAGYKRAFAQESVLWETMPVCVAF